MYDPFSPDPRPVASPDEAQQAIAGYRPSFGQFMGAMAGEGFWATTTAQGAAWLKVKRVDDAGETPLMAEEWQQSPWYRPGLAWDEGLTPGRARAMAEIHDENTYRRWVIGQRQAGLPEQIAGFGAAVVGSIPAAENFIPLAGPAFKAAQVAKLARAGIPVMEAATARFGQIGGRALVMGTDAAAGTALAEPFLISSRRAFGDDVGLADAMLDIAMGAMVGAAIGGAAGVWARGRAPADAPVEPTPSFRSQQAAADVMGKSMLDVADGRPVNLAEAPAVRSELEAMIESTGRRVGDAERAPFREVTADPARRAEDLTEFYRRAVSEEGVTVPKQRLRLGEVADELAQRIKAETGLDVTGYRRSIDVSEARHIARDHGPAARATTERGALPVTEEDIGRYFDIVEKPDAIYASRNKRGNSVLIHEKQIGDWHYVVEEVRAGKRMLALETFYKERGQRKPNVRGGGQSGGADTQVGSGLARPGRTPAQPAGTDPSAAVAELEPAWRDPDLTPAAEALPEPPRPLPKSRAEEHGLDPATGDFDELADIKRMEAAGRLTAADRKALEAAEADLKKVDGAGDAFIEAAACLSRA
jgi:hypothetical protein